MAKPSASASPPPPACRSAPAWPSRASPTEVESLLAHVGLRARLPERARPAALLDAMRRDKKRRGGRLRFVLLRDIGDPIVTDDVATDDVVAVLESLNP